MLWYDVKSTKVYKGHLVEYIPINASCVPLNT